MFKHNQKVTCEIDGKKITDARISINADGDPFICQNKKNGSYTENKLGYKYSWGLNRDFTNQNVTNLLPTMIKSFDNPQEGDEYKSQTGSSRFVLGVSGRTIDLSQTDSKDSFGGTYTKEDLITRGYTIVQDKPEPEEIIEVDGNKYKLIK